MLEWVERMRLRSVLNASFGDGDVIIARADLVRQNVQELLPSSAMFRVSRARSDFFVGVYIAAEERPSVTYVESAASWLGR